MEKIQGTYLRYCWLLLKVFRRRGTRHIWNWGTVCINQTKKQALIWIGKNIDTIKIGLAILGLEEISGAFISWWELLFSSMSNKTICCPPEIQLIRRVAVRPWGLNLPHQDQIWAVLAVGTVFELQDNILSLQSIAVWRKEKKNLI